jgi:hypothetical protein
MPAVGLADPGLGFFSAQQVRTEKKMVKESTLGLIQVVSGYLTATTLYGGLIEQFQWQWTWKVVEKGKDFVVQFPSVEKLKMMMEFDEFKLKGTGAYIKVSAVTKKVVPVGRLYSVWARAEGVPDEMKHYKGICEVGSLIGAVDDVDMQILSDLDVVRFQVDVRSISKFPMVKQFTVKPWMYNITFSIERVLEEGNLPKIDSTPSEVEKVKDSEQFVDEEEQARAAKKLKASQTGRQDEKKSENMSKEENSECLEGMGEQVDNEQNREEKLEDMNVSQDIESSKDNKQAEKEDGKVDEEEREEELVDFEDSQDRLVEQEEEEMLESQESFNTKVQKITAESRSREELIEVKIENEKNKGKMVNEEPRRCSRLKDQEDADRTELAMKRAAKKNEISGNNKCPTVLNSSDETLLDITDKLGVISDNSNEMNSIVSVIKSLEHTRKIVYEESMKNNELLQPKSLDLFTQVTEMEDGLEEESDEELAMHTSPCRTQLSKPANKIIKLCSPVFRVELVKKRGRPPKNLK